MDTTQFTQLYKENIGSLKGFALKLTKNLNDSEELVQEAMIKAFRSRHTFKPGSNFKNWAFTIVKNTFITQYNKRKRRNVVETPVDELHYLLTDTTRNAALSTLNVGALWENIQQLSTKSKEPLTLSIKGYRYDEIAEKLNIPIGTVKSRINFARTKLKNSLTRDVLVAA